MIADKELKQLLDKAYNNIKSKFDPKALLFLDRIKRKTQRYKKLNDTEEKRLKEIANKN